MTQNIPDPKDLLAEAEAEFVTPNLSSYSDTIVTLREKGMTWRDVAAWLTQKGIRCTHNEVYYVAKKREQEEAEQERYIEENGLEAEFVEFHPAKAAARKMKKEKELEDGEAE
jgi:hypothetical protein